MKKIFKWLFLTLTLLFLLMTPNLSTYAMDENADSNDGSQASNQQVAGGDGINENRMGYVIWLSDGSGKSLNGNVHYITTDGKAPYVPSGRLVQNELHTRFGEGANARIAGTPEWGVGPISAGNISNEPILTAFITQRYQDTDSGGTWVCLNYLGYTPEQLAELIETNEEVYLNFMPFIVGAIYGASESSHSGQVIAGTCIGWARRSDPGNYLSKYTHAAINNSHHYEEPWMGLSIPTNTASGVKHSNEEILSNIGLGIVSYTVKASDKDLIKVYTDENGELLNTSYGKTSNPVKVRNEGSYTVVKSFISEKRTKLTGKQGYDTFGTELAPKQKEANGERTVEMKEIEKTIVVLLKKERDVPEITHTEDAIYSHELNAVIPYLSSSKRHETADTIGIYKFKLDNGGTIKIKQEVEGTTATNANRNLYNSGAGNFAKYSEVTGEDGKELEAGDSGTIVPNYSLLVSRKDWDNKLVITDYRNTDDVKSYAKDILGFTVGKKGEQNTASELVANVDMPFQAKHENKYTFKFEPSDACKW